MDSSATSAQLIAELREFAGFAAAEQSYIQRSLTLGLSRYERARGDFTDAPSIRSQRAAYRLLEPIRRGIPQGFVFDGLDRFLAPLIRVTGFDLAQAQLSGFAAYRFLYERLLGADVRPWLPAAFCAAAALPQIHPDRRLRLLHSLSQAVVAAPAWSERAPQFIPVLNRGEPCIRDRPPEEGLQNLR